MEPVVVDALDAATGKLRWQFPWMVRWTPHPRLPTAPYT